MALALPYLSVMLTFMHGLRHGAVLLLVDLNRYLHEVVQKAMTGSSVDVPLQKDQHDHRGANGLKTTNGTNPLLAAYEVCHDLCCGMVLEILHAQAVKLASRVRGLWATQLVVLFDKESQVRVALICGLICSL